MFLFFSLLTLLPNYAWSTNSEGQAYLDKNFKQENVITLPSGLQYQILQHGDINKATPMSTSDLCTCHYEGKLIDGAFVCCFGCVGCVVVLLLLVITFISFFLFDCLLYNSQAFNNKHSTVVTNLLYKIIFSSFFSFSYFVNKRFLIQNIRYCL